MKRFLVQKDADKGGDEKKMKSDGGEGTAASCDLYVVTYNIDGLSNETHLMPRMNAVVDLVLNGKETEKPDLIMFQEVVPDCVEYLVGSLVSAGYVCCPPDMPEAPYFTLLFTNPARIKITKQTRTPWPNSEMCRDLVEVECLLDEKIQACFMTSHLESLKPSSAKRCQQLKSTLDKLTAFKGLAIFGGDTNLREAEVDKNKSSYNMVTDAWVAAGSPVEKKYTWDLQCNDNLQMPGSNQPRMRLDRLLINKAIKGVRVTSFNLMGTEKITAQQVYPSDHFGIGCRLSIPSPS